MSKKYIGIDVGRLGFIAVIDNGEYRFCSIEDSDNLSLSKFLLDETLGQSTAVVIEDVHALYGSSAEGTFNFGWIKGFLTGLLVAHKIPYTLVQPKEWQGEIWTNADMVVSHKKVTCKNGKEINRKETDTKATSINAAQRLFPSVDFRRNERCRKIDDNKVDALLMAEYARRKNL